MADTTNCETYCPETEVDPNGVTHGCTLSPEGHEHWSGVLDGVAHRCTCGWAWLKT